MLKEAEYVCILGSCCLFDALVMHVYKNILYWKFLLITERIMLFHCIDPLVKHQMSLGPLLTIWRNL